MSTLPSPNFPKSNIPAWERRRRSGQRQWNGKRRGDPQLPRLETALAATPTPVVLYALAGTLIGLGILILALPRT
jgi:hypothetical protein